MIVMQSDWIVDSIVTNIIILKLLYHQIQIDIFLALELEINFVNLIVHNMTKTHNGLED